MINSYLINLDQDSNRLEFFKANFDKLAIPFERIAAVDGRKFPEDAYRDFQKERPRDGRRWLRGQMGCFLSHYAAWQRIAAGSARFGAVFEDDIHVSDDLREVLADDAWIPDDVDLIRLDTSTNRVRLTPQPRLTFKQRNIYGVRSTSWCAGGYLLNRRAAQRLIDLAPRLHNTSDILLYNFEESAIAPTFNILQFHPALCTQDKHLLSGSERFPSNIELDSPASQRWRFRNLLKRCSPVAIIVAMYRTRSGYKRIGFR